MELQMYTMYLDQAGDQYELLLQAIRAQSFIGYIDQSPYKVIGINLSYQLLQNEQRINCSFLVYVMI